MRRAGQLTRVTSGPLKRPAPALLCTLLLMLCSPTPVCPVCLSCACRVSVRVPRSARPASPVPFFFYTGSSTYPFVKVRVQGVKTIVGKFVIAMEGEWALADSSVVARQLGHRTRLIAVIAMVSVSSANSKALESAYALQLLELLVERLDGPPVPPASCWLLREGDGVLDGPP